MPHSISPLRLLAALACCLAGAATAAVSTPFIESAGVLGGWDQESDVDLTEVSVFLRTTEFQSWSLGTQSNLRLSAEGRLGHLSGEGDGGAFLTLAPRLGWASEDWPLEVFLTSGPAYYTQDDFGDYDLGSNFEFISSLGVEISTSENWSLGYRFQHTSNGGFGDDNPGLDMHLVGVGYRF